MIALKYGIQIVHVIRTHAEMIGMVDATSNTAEGDSHPTSDTVMKAVKKLLN